MNDERVLLRILCSKTKNPHVVGKVLATSRGPEIELAGAVRTGVGNADYRSTPERHPFADPDWEGGYVWCQTCRKAMLTNAPTIREALGRGSKSVALMAVGYLLDPLGVQDRSVSRRRGDAQR